MQMKTIYHRHICCHHTKDVTLPMERILAFTFK